MTDEKTSGGLYGEASGEPVPVASAPGLLDQVTGLVTEPVALFQRLRTTPVWKGALALTVVVTLGMTVAWGLKVDVDAMLRPVLEQNPNIAPEQLDKIIEMQGKFLLPSGIIGVLLMIPLFTALLAWFYWLIGKVTAEGEAPSFQQALSMTVVPGLAALPKLLLATVMCLVKPINGLTPDKVTPTSLGYFLTVESPKLQAFLFRFDLFTLATLALLFLAARHTLRLKASGAAFCTGLAGFLMLVLPALFGK